jgi:hypothetical protein
MWYHAIGYGEELYVLAVVPGEGSTFLRVILARSTWVLQLTSTIQQAQSALDHRTCDAKAEAGMRFTPPPALSEAFRWNDDRRAADGSHLGGLTWRTRGEGMAQSAQG